MPPSGQNFTLKLQYWAMQLSSKRGGHIYSISEARRLQLPVEQLHTVILTLNNRPDVKSPEINYI